MTHKNIYEILNHSFPDLIQKLKNIIEKSELEYSLRSDSDSFLWEHTVYVSGMAMTLSKKEGIDPRLPVLTALFHDCGKFMDGAYHENDIPEEKNGADIAETILKEEGCPVADINVVVKALLGLYNDQKGKSAISQIVHDADFLVKFGYMGFANFFEKSVLRGMTMSHSILKKLSKELTYAASLESNMFTASGKKMARSKAQITRMLFEKYLQELKEAGISTYEIKEMDFNCCEGPDDVIPLVLVLPTSCTHCGSDMDIAFGRDRGIKCEKLMVAIGCKGCNEEEAYDFSFCLPELVKSIN